MYVSIYSPRWVVDMNFFPEFQFQKIFASQSFRSGFFGSIQSDDLSFGFDATIRHRSKTSTAIDRVRRFDR